MAVYVERVNFEVRRTLIDICFEKYNQILVLNQYDISKGPIAKLFGRDGFENADLKFDFGTATDLKVGNLNFLRSSPSRSLIHDL